MASHQQQSPTAGIPQHHGLPPGHPQANGVAHLPPQGKGASQYLTSVNENVWLSLGALSEQLGDGEGALSCYERCLHHNFYSVQAMQAIASLLRSKDQFQSAIEYLKRILQIDATNGDVWGSLGHCYLMMDDLQNAYSSYQQALYHLQDPKEPKLWYGIGILYDRYGSLEHAEEAFSQVMRMQPDFEKANEIYFRLGIIYKQQQKFQQSLECFTYIVKDPPRPLTEEDIWFQIGHVHEQEKNYDSAKMAYRRVLERDPNHAKVLQQLGWLHHQQSSTYQSQEQAIEYLEKSVAADQSDAQSWYLLGRCYMSQTKYPKAYEAYQQAVYRDGRNPTFWCSIGVLYYQINQYRDALDAYSRAIRLNPNISEVWYDLGTLYESCNNQTADALDAYQRAADLDPSNVHIKARLQLLQNGQPTSGMPNQNSAPLPQDVHPQAYQPATVNGPPGPVWGAPAPSQPPPGPAPPALGGSGDWPRRLAGIQEPQPPPHTVNPYEQRDGNRPPGPHGPPRPVSPRHEARQQYHEPSRPATQAPPRRGFSPSPKTHNVAPNVLQGPPNLPPQASGPQSQLPPHQQPPPQNRIDNPNRITNPNYGTQASSMPPTPSGHMASGPPAPGPLPPYNRMASPPPEVRPLVQNDIQSPNQPQPNYQHHHNPSALGGIASGAPPPASAFDAAQRDRDERPPSAMKRIREWDDNPSPSQKPMNDEKRPRLEEHLGRRPTPPEQKASPAHRSPQNAESRPVEEPRRPAEVYHPSEAAHHPTSLPSINATQPLPRMSEPPKTEERREQHEPAARKMDVDEDYDDSGEDEKRALPRSERNSPRSGGPPANGMPHQPPTPVEQKS